MTSHPRASGITSCGFTECPPRGTSGRPIDRPLRAAVGAGASGDAGMFHVGGGARVYRSDGCGAIVKLDDFGKVTLITGASEIGQGSETAVAMIVAEEASAFRLGASRS